MDEENRPVPAQVITALTEEDPPALVPVAVEELSTKLVAALDIIAALIPDLRTPHPATAGKVRGARTVSREAVLSIVAMVESSAVLQELNLIDTERAHEVLEFDDGFRLLDERIDRLRRQVRYTAEARWAEVASQAMKAYLMARALAESRKCADLAPHVATIKRHLDRRNAATAKRKKAKTE